MFSKFLLKIDRGLAGKKGWQFLIPFMLAAVSFLAVSFIWYVCNGRSCVVNEKISGEYKINSILDGAFYLLFTNGGQNLYPYSNHLWGALITVLGILILAVVTSSITNFFEKRAEGYLTGETAYHLKNHIVIMGASDVIYSIINQHYKSGQYILVQTGKDVKSLRREVFSFLDQRIKREYIVFIYGDRTSAEDVSRLYLAHAAEVFIIGDTDEGIADESYRDAYNMDSVNAVAKVLSDSARRDRLLCHILFEYQTTFSAFQFAELSKEIKDRVIFRPFNFYEMWAQKVLILGGAGGGNPGGTYKYTYKFLDETKDGTYITENSESTVHLIIVGMSKMGIALAIEAAHLLHFPNFSSEHHPSRKTRITFIDENADREKDFFCGRFKELFRLSRYRYADADAPESSRHALDNAPWQEPDEDWLDIEWEFIKGRVEQECVQAWLAKAAGCPARAVTIAICLPLSHEAIAAALYLPDSVYEDCLQILTYQRLSGYIVNNIAGASGGAEECKYRKLRPFGMIDEGYDSRLDDASKACLVSYVYKNNSDYKLKEYKEQDFWETWIETAVSNRWSDKFYLNAIGLKLRSIGCMPEMNREKVIALVSEHLDAMARVEHNRWNLEKLLTGYRPLTREELHELNDCGSYGSTAWEAKRDALKKWPKRAHLDVCSNERLREVDPGICHFDEDLSRAIPYIAFWGKK